MSLTSVSPARRGAYHRRHRRTEMSPFWGFLMIGLRGCPFSEALHKELLHRSETHKLLWISSSRSLHKESLKRICHHPSFPILFRIPMDKWSTVPRSIKRFLEHDRRSFEKIGGYQDFVRRFHPHPPASYDSH